MGYASLGQFLDEVDKGDRDELCAMALLDGWGEEWEMAATVAAAIHNSIVDVLMYLGKETEPDDYKQKEVFRPRFDWEREPSKPRGSLETGLSQLRGMTGL